MFNGIISCHGLELVHAVCVSGVAKTRICNGHEELSSCSTVPEAIKFDEKPICVKMGL